MHYAFFIPFVIFFWSVISLNEMFDHFKYKNIYFILLIILFL